MSPIAAPGGDTISASIELFTGMSYLILPSVMLASYIVGACKDKTMSLMFSYPMSRRSILLAQLLAVWIFNTAALALTKLLIYSCIQLASPFWQASFPLDFTMTSPGFTYS